PSTRSSFQPMTPGISGNFALTPKPIKTFCSLTISSTESARKIWCTADSPDTESCLARVSPSIIQ
ncbi:hypothetical protein, partial [Pseudomonas viridiflava]|uniref:hypothetical protein n=1 Tax=Pseudomonas viridiflava TaxID=33069 RepID=UPI00197CE6C1